MAVWIGMAARRVTASGRAFAHPDGCLRDEQGVAELRGSGYNPSPVPDVPGQSVLDTSPPRPGSASCTAVMIVRSILIPGTSAQP